MDSTFRLCHLGIEGRWNSYLGCPVKTYRLGDLRQAQLAMTHFRTDLVYLEMATIKFDCGASATATSLSRKAAWCKAATKSQACCSSYNLTAWVCLTSARYPGNRPASQSKSSGPAHLPYLLYSLVFFQHRRMSWHRQPTRVSLIWLLSLAFLQLDDLFPSCPHYRSTFAG
jgi:hypothetical protein